MTEREALKLALVTLEAHADIGIKSDKAITAIKEALAQPEHGWTPERIAGIARLKDAQDKKLAQRTWAGLTHYELQDFHTQWVLEGKFEKLIDAVEAKLKEKNT